MLLTEICIPKTSIELGVSASIEISENIELIETMLFQIVFTLASF